MLNIKTIKNIFIILCKQIKKMHPVISAAHLIIIIKLAKGKQTCKKIRIEQSNAISCSESKYPINIQEKLSTCALSVQ